VPRPKVMPTEICEWLDIDVIEGAIAPDHMYLYLSVPPKYAPSHVFKVLKGKSAEYLRRNFPASAKRYWGLHIWACGYFVSIVGIDREVIRNYVEDQQKLGSEKSNSDLKGQQLITLARVAFHDDRHHVVGSRLFDSLFLS
jgi:REP element-mobilizing transposase RayT